jgi:putative transposase
MSRRLRIEFPGAVYHVYARGNSKDAVFLDDADRLKFLDYMGRGAQGYGFIYHSYCLMGNHFHLLLETPQANLSEGMHWLDSCYAGHFNWAHEHVGHVFQGRFQSIVVQQETYLLELCRYIVLNPVRACIVKDPAYYPWSSFREIAGLGSGLGGAVSAGWILSHFGDDPERARHEYARFVRDGAGRSSPFADVVAGTVLGDRDFRTGIRERVLSECRLEDIPAAQLDAFRPGLRELFSADEPLLRNERNTRIRSACLEWRYTRTEVAAFCGISLSSVSAILEN